MRPDVGDILGQIQRGLTEEVMPEITNPHVMERVAYMIMLLDHCVKRWDRAYPALREDHADLRETLEAIAAERDWGGAGPDTVAALQEIAGLAAEELPPEALGSCLALRAENERRRESISRLLRALSSEDLKSRASLRGIRALAGAWVRRQIGRDREWVQAGEIVW
jgi:hypothetical protein